MSITENADRAESAGNAENAENASPGGADFDVVIRGGTVFDGTGAPGVRADVGIRAGVVAAISPAPLPVSPGTQVVEAEGRWVTPGFVDTHTHYDVELLVSPGLGESVRHGVTTVLVGNCSISGVYSGAVDVADLFSRVEALPRDSVLAALEQKKTWSGPADWRRTVEDLPLGPNVASFLGHSDVRASVMGLGRATDPEQSPSRDELRTIDRRINAALDEGFLGVSTMTNPWDKMDGDRYRSRTLPSTHASWGEFRRISRLLRRRDRVLQGVPNLNTKVDVAFYAATSTGLFRKPLRVSLLAAADTLAEPWVNRIFRPIAWAANTLGRGKFVWQHLPTTFKVWADGIDLVVFEEFGSGREALHLVDEMAAPTCSSRRATGAGSAATSRSGSARACGTGTSTTRSSWPAPTSHWSARPSATSRAPGSSTRQTPTSTWWWSTAPTSAGPPPSPTRGRRSPTGWRGPRA